MPVLEFVGITWILGTTFRELVSAYEQGRFTNIYCRCAMTADDLRRERENEIRYS
jgi:hypothetical protein